MGTVEWITLCTVLIGFLGFGSLSVCCFVGKIKLISQGILWGLVSLGYAVILFFFVSVVILV